MSDWESDMLTGYLKVPEGVHSIKVLGEPEQVESKVSGKQQWCFPAEVDGVPGRLAPPKTLGKIIAGIHRATGKWPVAFRVKRTGMDLKTRFELVGEDAA